VFNIKKRLLTKIFTAIIAGVLALSLISCDKLSGLGGTQISDTPFTAHVEIDTEKADYVANVKRLGMGLWEMEIVEPSNIAGLTIKYDGASVSSTKDGFTISHPVENIADSALFLQLFRTIDNAISVIDPQGEIIDGKYVLSGSIPITSYQIIFNPETNTPQEIKLPESAITAYISDFQIAS
jgi:hypothetical protein